MSEVLENFILEAHVEAAFAERLRALRPQAKEVIAQLVAQLRPSANTLRAYIDLAEAIAARDDVAFEGLFASEAVREILAEKDNSRKEKQKLLRSHLERLRYPTVTKIQDELEHCVSELRRKIGVTLELPKDLEGDRVGFKLATSGPEDLQRSLEKLQQLREAPEFSRIFQLLRGEAEI